MKISYTVQPEIKSLGILATVVAEIYGVSIQESNSDLEQLKAQTVDNTLTIAPDTLEHNPILQSYRDLVSKVGRSAKKFPPPAQMLVELIRRRGILPTINTAVDAYNLVVVKTFLALGVHDLDKVGSAITFRLSPGQEPFRAVGSDSEKQTQAGDYVYADEHQVLAWLDSKDSDQVKLSLETKNIVLIIQGTDVTTREYNLAAAQEACKLITRFCGGKYEMQPLT